MKFELTDEKALLVSGLGCAFFGAHALASPRSFHDLYMKSVSSGASWAWWQRCRGAAERSLQRRRGGGERWRRAASGARQAAAGRLVPYLRTALAALLIPNLLLLILLLLT